MQNIGTQSSRVRGVRAAYRCPAVLVLSLQDGRARPRQTPLDRVSVRWANRGCVFRGEHVRLQWVLGQGFQAGEHTLGVQHRAWPARVDAGVGEERTDRVWTQGV